jgi:hypothetical protein
MKTMINYLKEFLQENKEDLMYLLFAGVPMGIIEVLLSPFWVNLSLF